MNHGNPVESVLMFPGDGLIASAGGNTMKIWDIYGGDLDLIKGGNLVQSVSNHQKAITCMAFNKSKSRILTGSLDYHVKVYNVEDFRVVHSIKYPAQILSVGISVFFYITLA